MENFMFIVEGFSDEDFINDNFPQIPVIHKCRIDSMNTDHITILKQEDGTIWEFGYQMRSFYTDNKKARPLCYVFERIRLNLNLLRYDNSDSVIKSRYLQLDEMLSKALNKFNFQAINDMYIENGQMYYRVVIKENKILPTSNK